MSEPQGGGRSYKSAGPPGPIEAPRAMVTNYRYVVGIGSPSTCARLTATIELWGERAANLTHPGACVCGFHVLIQFDGIVRPLLKHNWILDSLGSAISTGNSGGALWRKR